MQHNAAEIWLNAMYVNALIFSQIGLKINIKSMHWQSRSALCLRQLQLMAEGIT